MDRIPATLALTEAENVKAAVVDAKTAADKGKSMLRGPGLRWKKSLKPMMT